MESDEETFTLQITDDSGLEDNNESFENKTTNVLINAGSWRNSDSLGKKRKTMSIRLLSDNYYDEDFDDEQSSDTHTELDQNKQAEVTGEVQNNPSESFRDQVTKNNIFNTQDSCLERRGENDARIPGLEFNVQNITEDLNGQIETDNAETEDSGIQCVDNSNTNIEVDLKGNEGCFLTDKNWKYIENDLVNGEFEIGEIDFNVEEQVREDFESPINPERHQDHPQVENKNHELEEGELEDSEVVEHSDSMRRQREKSAGLIEVPDEVNDRIFGNGSDNLSDVSTLDNSYYEDFEHDQKNPSPPGDGEFSTIEDDDPWDYVQSSLSDDCVIVEEIERPRKFAKSCTLPKDHFTESTSEELPETNDGTRKTSRKRKLSRSSNHNCIEEKKVCNNNSTGVDYDDFTGICSKEEVSELPEEVESVSRETKKYYGRDENHPLFRDIDGEFCEKVMKLRKQGDIIIRPSCKGSDYLKITWKVTDDVYQHIKVKKKLRSRSSKKFRYWINNREFRDLNEIISKYITPMAQNAVKLLKYKHFKKGINGIKATAEELLKASKSKNPNSIPYIISAVKKSPGKFSISYLPRVTCYHEYIKIVPEGFRFRDQLFENLNDLLIYFKANSKEVKSTASKEEPATLTRSSHPATPKPTAPRVPDLTPSLLELIQDFPDDTLDSMRQILSSLNQSTSNPPPTFNQNPGPAPFIFNGFHQPYPPAVYPTVSYPPYQPTMQPFVQGIPLTNNNNNNVALPVPYPGNLDLPLPNFSQPNTSRGESSLPPPPGTS